MADFCELAVGLQAPNLDTFGARTPKVSGYMPKYSRFRETATGDRFRSTLRGRACSATRQILRLGRRQIGNAQPALPFPVSQYTGYALLPEDARRLRDW